jgi:RNA polymerase sigma-70 factor (ECF subfamily)
MTTGSTFDPRIGEIAQAERRRLLDVAFRMLGDVALAEDAVQESFVRLSRADLDTIEDVRGWLIVAVGRICLDQLRSAPARHEAATDLGVLDGRRGAPGASGGVDPADRATLDDAIRIALLTVLERLTPAERTAFVLHDVFQLPFDTIGTIVGRTPTACRQLARRARQRLSGTPVVRRHVEPAEHRVLVERFIAAASGGDIEALTAVLDPDVVGSTMPGGVVGTGKPVTGREKLARRLLGGFGPRSNATLLSASVGGRPAVVVTRDRRTVAVLLLDIRAGLVHHMYVVGDPAGLLGHIDQVGQIE